MIQKSQTISFGQIHHEPCGLWDHSSTAVPGIMSTYADYRSPSSAILFQLGVLFSYLNTDQEIDRSIFKAHVMERSLKSASMMFIETIEVPDRERDRLQQIADEIGLRVQRPKVVFILDVEPELALERIRRRKNLCDDYSLKELTEYRKKLHKIADSYRKIGTYVYISDSQEVILAWIMEFLKGMECKDFVCDLHDEDDDPGHNSSVEAASQTA